MKKEQTTSDSLVIEHAKLVAQLSKKKGVNDAEILKRLKEIEETLGMNAQQIANRAIQKYKREY